MSAFNFTSVSDNTLIEHLRELIRREREVLIDVLHHLNEVERRRLHLKLGYRSLFAYCTDTLKYSESAAGRRVQAARVIRRYPSVAGLLERGEVNLSTVSKVAGIALSRNDPGLFDRIRGMTQDEAAAVASEYRPRVRPRDRVRPVSVRAEPANATSVQVLLAATPAGTRAPRPAAAPEPSPAQQPAATQEPVPAPATNPAPAPNDGHSRGGSSVKPTSREHDPQAPVEQKFVVQFVAGRDLMTAIEQVRALLSFRLPADAPLEDLLAIITEEFIDRHSPDRRRERRARNRERNRERARGANSERSKGNDHNERSSDEQRNARNPRHVPRAVRDEVFGRAGGRCTYTGPDGTRCKATHHLQVDHIVPVTRGGSGAPTNLRILCAAHNRLEAERILGSATMWRHVRRE